MTSNNTAADIIIGSMTNANAIETSVASVDPGQTIRVQVNPGRTYAIAQHGEVVQDLLVEEIGADLFVTAPNGATVVFGDFVALCNEGQCALITEDPAHSDSAMSMVEAMDDEMGAETDHQDSMGDEDVATATDGNAAAYPSNDSEMLAESDITEDAEIAGQNSDDEDDDEGGIPWLYAGLGLLAAGGIALALDDDDSSVALPEFTGGPTATASIAENAPITDVVFDAEASIPDASAQNTIVYSLAGAEAGAFNIDSQTGEVRLNASADFETQSSYSIEVVATRDPGGAMSSQTVTVSVTDVPLAIQGLVVAGPVIDGNGLVAEAFTADGISLGTAPVNADGTFTIDANPDDYDGLVLVRISDASPGPDYLHEGSGNPEDLTIDLRAIGVVDDEGVINVNVNLATEIAVRQLLGDTGGDGAASAVVLGTATQADATAHYSNVLRAFGLSPDIDLGAVDPHPVNAPGFGDASAEAQALGDLLAILAGAEVSLGLTTAELTQYIVDGTQGGVLSQTLLEDLRAAATLVDGVAGNAGGSASRFLGDAEAGVSSIAISVDSGSNALDFITNMTAQTITATLIATLVDSQAVYGSVDNGETWEAIADASGSTVIGTTVSWTTTLDTNADIQKIIIGVTGDGQPPSGAGENFTGRVLSQGYQIDTTGPIFGESTFVADENQVAAISLAATDTNGIPAAGGYTLGGADAALFTISDAGALSFINAQDFEAPLDADSDGIFNVDVTVTDTVGNSTTQAVTVTLQNVNEAPTVSTAIVDSTAVTNEAFSLDVSSSFADPDASDTLTYTATGLPTGLTISSAGVISGTATAAAEATDIVVTATDGTFAAPRINTSIATSHADLSSLTAEELVGNSNVVRQNVSSAAGDEAATVVWTRSFQSADTTPTLSGSLGAALGTNEVVAIYDGATRLGSATTTGTDWTFTAGNLASGEYQLRVQVEDATSGSASTGRASSGVYSVVVDDTAPDVNLVSIVLNDDYGPETGIVAPGGVTDDAQLAISGSLDASLTANQRLSVFDGTTFLGFAEINGTQWSFESLSDLVVGSHSITARVENIASGAQSTATDALEFTVQSLAITSITDDTGFIQGNVLNQTYVNGELNLSGTTLTDDQNITVGGKLGIALEDGQILRLYDSGAPIIGNITVNADLTWSADVNNLAYADHNLSVQIEDSANPGTPIISQTVEVGVLVSDSLSSLVSGTSLQVGGIDREIDLTQIGGTSQVRIDAINLSDLLDSGSNQVTLDIDDVLNAGTDLFNADTGYGSLVTNDVHQIRIVGDSGDTVDLADAGWTTSSSVTNSNNGQTYNIYTNSNDASVQLLIEDDLTVL